MCQAGKSVVCFISDNEKNKWPCCTLSQYAGQRAKMLCSTTQSGSPGHPNLMPCHIELSELLKCSSIHILECCIPLLNLICQNLPKTYSIEWTYMIFFTIIKPIVVIPELEKAESPPCPVLLAKGRFSTLLLHMRQLSIPEVSAWKLAQPRIWETTWKARLSCRRKSKPLIWGCWRRMMNLRSFLLRVKSCIKLLFGVYFSSYMSLH